MEIMNKMGRTKDAGVILWDDKCRNMKKNHSIWFNHRVATIHFEDNVFAVLFALGTVKATYRNAITFEEITIVDEDNKGLFKKTFDKLFDSDEEIMKAVAEQRLHIEESNNFEAFFFKGELNGEYEDIYYKGHAVGEEYSILCTNDVNKAIDDMIHIYDTQIKKTPAFA